MNWTDFEQNYAADLNEQQKRAVQKVDGPVLLLAVPGSGKTTVLITRLGYMALCCGIEPEKILTVTYTIAATKDMAARCAACFGSALAERFEFRTINGICAKIIQYYGRHTGREPFALMSDEKQTAAMLSEIFQRTEGEYPSETELKNVRSRIAYIKNSMLTDAEIEQMERSSEDSLHIGEIYRQYCRAMREARQMDYDDQMVYAYRILKKIPGLLAYFQKQYSHICVDEAQDTSRIQHAILALLASERENLFLVGDEDQSIYGFRAAYPQALLHFEEDHPGAEILLMEKNYRSTANIVKAADRFIQKNTFRHKKNMKAIRGEAADIREIAVSSRNAQYLYLAKAAESCRRMQEPCAETAVLYRDNESALPLLDLLERNGTPYRMRQTDMTFFTHRTVLDIVHILALAQNPYDTEAFLQIYYKINTFIRKEDALRIAQLSQDLDIPVLDAALEHGRLPAHAAASTRTVRTHLENMCRERADKALYRITEYLGYREYLTRSGIKGENKLEILRILASREASPETFLARLAYLKDLIREETPQDKNMILLSTMHASKGLEYDTVYLMDVIDGILPESVPGSPGTASQPELEDYEEARRLFYVAVTRARNRLNLFTTKKKSTFCDEFLGKKTNETKKRKGPQIPSGSLSPKSRSSYADRTSPGSGAEAYRAQVCRSFCAQLGEGSLVQHQRFGEGVVLSVSEERLTVRFSDRIRTLDTFFTAEHHLLQESR